MKIAPEGFQMPAEVLACSEVVIFVVVDNVPVGAFRAKLDEPIPVIPATRLDFEARPIFSTMLPVKETRS